LNDANDRGPRSPRVRHCDWKFLSDLNHNAKEGTVAIVINKSVTDDYRHHARAGQCALQHRFTVAAVDRSCAGGELARLPTSCDEDQPHNCQRATNP
jgi:hypothetical protein